MSQDNHFHQYGYDHYLKAPTRSRTKVRAAGGVNGILSKVQSPVVATVALVAAAALFIGVIVMTYPSGGDVQKQIPIIKADLRPIKTAPVNRGGMNIPHRDSTILARHTPSALQSERQEIENLFARPRVDLVTKEQAIERAMATHPMVSAKIEYNNVPALLRDGVSEHRKEGAIDQDAAVSASKNIDIVENNTQDIASAFALKEPTAKDILQKIGSSDGDEQENILEFSSKVASAAMLVKPHRAQMHAAATSPQTLEFVRDILNAKATQGNQTSNGTDVARIEPALGAGTGVNVTSGSYFVQLASITDPARAGKEWSKMKVRYKVLATSKFRVQEAVLSRGTFYRIQAGPMSKSSANSVCDALKQANKPGGCLVVK